MNSSSRFAVSVHVLALLALEARPVPSAYIAGSVNTNPVVIRRILALLNKAGFTHSTLGASGGTTLALPASKINLLDLYRAVEEPGVLSLHRSSPNPTCPVGRNITSILGGIFEQAQLAMENVIEAMTLQDVLDQLNAAQSPR